MANLIDSPEGSLEYALSQIGAPPDRVVRLFPQDGITAVNFEYSDLIRGRRAGDVQAVVEKDGSPLLYVAKGSPDAIDDERQLASLLANRGETALLLTVPSGIARRTSARVWHCGLNDSSFEDLNLADSARAKAILGDLQQGIWADPNYAYQEQRLRDLLVKSVRHVAGALRTQSGFSDDEDQLEVLGLIGRALFARFLLDREILSGVSAPALWRLLDGDGASAFASPKQAAATCMWLDSTFNGEFMPLPLNGRSYESYFAVLQSRSKAALEPLGWIMNRTDAYGQLPLWEYLDFSHIPVGTLSEVYEDYAHHRSPEKAKETSVHFTPRHIARMMVRQAFAGLEREKAASARLLDPATGAAVFLGLGFRELARQHASLSGEWPDTQQLRHILYRQLRGLDINPAALNLAALTLYLTAIELDNNPLPPEKLKFKERLLGNVLFNVAIPDPSDRDSGLLGSLRTSSPAGTGFDIVIGNPPWTSQKGGGGGETLVKRAADKVAKKCISTRAPTFELSYQHPDKVPDLAFAWKAVEWAREGGIIALVMHQRILVKQSEGWSAARQALFSCIQVDGILNAGEFADDNKFIWPGIQAPFCILFARNHAPKQDHRVVVLTPTVEPSLLTRRQLRLDPNATVIIRQEELEDQLNPISVLAKGSELDLVFLQRCLSRVTVGKSEWRGQATSDAMCRQDARDLPMSTLGECLTAIAADMPARGMKKADERSGKTKLHTPAWFAQLPDETLELCAKERLVGLVDCAPLLHFDGDSNVPRKSCTHFVKRPIRSSPDISYFTAPLSLMLREAPGRLREPGRAFLLKPPLGGQIPVIYPFSFVGVPLLAGAAAEFAAKYICLWINSSFYAYFHTLTSSRFAYGRRVINNEEMASVPVVSPDVALQAELTSEKEVNELFSILPDPQVDAVARIDAWLNNIAGFSDNDYRLICDTLSVSYPIGSSKKSGLAWVEPKVLDEYVDALRYEISDIAPDAVDVDSLKVVGSSWMSGWRFLAWRLSSERVCESKCVIDSTSEENLLELVKTEYPNGQVWAVTRDGWQVFGQIALPRLWLPSRAPLVATTIVAWADQRMN
ncbi:N-6 DNA methylase [Denitratisoma sp. agr-D3]